MTERTSDLPEEQLDYGTGTDGVAATGAASADGDETVENPVGFNAEPDQAEETSVETTDEGERSSVEEI
ncbi:MAG: hypothetical protein J0I20_04025 [Chloroflexi bacterium]|nr:hypothetical protein [Chloroflexota bacterium]OJW04278.1 MAG: hypothetical protein BGO39_10940 [Chloroflexi bacterium 54-19]